MEMALRPSVGRLELVHRVLLKNAAARAVPGCLVPWAAARKKLRGNMANDSRMKKRVEVQKLLRGGGWPQSGDDVLLGDLARAEGTRFYL